MKKSTIWMWVGVLVVLVLVGFYVGWGKDMMGNKNKSDYQAVFLSNGQVYFGKVSNETGKLVKVTDIYYLQVQQQVQPADKEKDSSNQPKVQLVKLGNEIHGPMDEMRINRDHVLFVEDLKTDGKVVSAIKDYQKNGNTSAQK